MRSSFPSRRSCRRATSSTCSRSSTARRCAPRSTVGQRRDGKVEIVSGLAGGDMVVTAGQLKLRDGVVGRIAGNGASAVAGGGRRMRRGTGAGEGRSRRRPRRSPDASRTTCSCPRFASSGRSSRRCCRSSSCWSASISYTRLSVREYPRIDEPVVSVSRHVSRRVGRGRRVAGDEAARGFARRHRGRRGDDLAEPLGDVAHQRPLHAEARSGLGRRRRPRQGGARARQAARHDRRADHRQGRGRRQSDHLHRGRGGLADAARGVRLRQALRAAAAVRAAGRRRRAHLRRAAGVDAHQPRPHAARRLQAHGAGRRGRDPPAERGDSGRAASNRRRASSPSSPRPTCARPSSSTTSSSPTSAAIRCASATSATPRSARSTSAIISRFNGKPSLNIGVIKQAVANPLELSKAVRAEVVQDERGAAAGHEARSSRTTRRCSSTARSPIGLRARSARRSCWSCW